MTVDPITPRVAPAFLRLGVLSDAEEDARNRLLSQLRRAQKVNARQESFYEGSRRAADLGISIPPHLVDQVQAVAAWPETAVDVMDERSDWRGWSANESLALDLVFEQNHGGIEIGQAVLDALIAGVGFASIGTGGEGEPDVLFKAESPSRVTATWDGRLRRAVEALRENRNGLRETAVVGWTLMTLNETVTTERRGGKLVVVERDQHNRDRVPMAMLLNRPRSSRMTGRSEITRFVRSTTEAGMRTLLGMEVAREFYAAPQRYLMGADEEMFVDEDGNRKSAWDVLIGKMLVAPRTGDDGDSGDLPVPGQFNSASPQPFTEVLKTYAQGLSGALGIPLTHFGYATDNPTSADSIRQADGRLNKRAGRRHRQYDLGLIEAGRLAVLWRDGSLPEAGEIKSQWVDPATPSPTAQADRAGKMISDGVLQPEWDFTLEQYGLSDDDIARVQAERRRTRGLGRLDEILNAANQVDGNNPPA